MAKIEKKKGQEPRKPKAQKAKSKLPRYMTESGIDEPKTLIEKAKSKR